MPPSVRAEIGAVALVEQAAPDGVQAAHVRARLKPPALPATPALSADLARWDGALVPALQALIAADLALRRRLLFWRSTARSVVGALQRLRRG